VRDSETQREIEEEVEKQRLTSHNEQSSFELGKSTKERREMSDLMIQEDEQTRA
jgi:hypothetical protein